MTRSRYARNGNLRAKLRRRLKAMELPCALCGFPIDYSLPAGDPLAFEVDEIVPVALGGSELDWDNLQPAHRLCNQRKGKKLNFTCDPPNVPCSRSGAGNEIGPQPSGLAEGAEGW